MASFHSVCVSSFARAQQRGVSGLCGRVQSGQAAFVLQGFPDKAKSGRTKTRTNDAGNMKCVASTLSDTDIENLAHYI